MTRKDEAGQSLAYELFPSVRTVTRPNGARSQRGSAILEFALITPLFLMLALGSLDLLWLAYATQNVNFITQQYAVCVEQNGQQNWPNCANGARTNATGLGLNAANLTVPGPIGQSVTASYSFQPLFGFLISSQTITRTVQLP